MKNDRQTKSELIEELKSVRGKVKKLETLLEKHKHTEPDITERKHLQEESIAPEEYYSSTFEKSQDGLLLVHRSKGDILDVNAYAQELLGYSKEEFLKNNLWGIGVVKDNKDFQEALSRLERDGVIYYDNISVKNKAGLLVNTEVVLVDKEKFIQCNIRDNTERKRAEEQLRQSEELFRLITENATDLIAVLDLEGKRIYSSPSYKSILGDPEWLRGTDSFQEIHPEDKEKIRRIFLETVRTGIGQRAEYRFLLKDGSVRYIESQGSVIRDENGNTIKVVVVSREVTERKRAEDVLRESEEKFRNLFNNSEVGMFRTRLDGSEIKEFNEKFLKILNYTHEEVVGKPSVNMWADKHEREKMAQLLEAEGHVTDFECGILNKQGEVRRCITSLHLYRDKGIIEGSIIDITERKQAEYALIYERNLLGALMNNVPDHIYFKDLNSRFLRVSKSLAERFGLSDPAQGIGKTDFDFFTEEHARPAYEHEQEIIKSGIPIVNLEEKETWPNGPETWVSTTKVPLRDLNGQIIGTFGISRDITEQKKLQNQLMQTQKVQSIGTLAGGIAHDFNNILGIILAYTSLLERSEGDKEKIAKSTTAITQAVGRGAALVHQILTFARQTDITIKPMSVPELAHEVVSMLQETFPKVIEFKEIFERGVPFIQADHAQIHQVVLNLCVNARDAMPKGGTITIQIQTTKLHDIIQQFPDATYNRYIRLSVSDTGTGMDEETKSRIFDPFFTTKELGKGTGLGLSVVFGVMQSHYGFISVDSEVGKGTTFHLYLPVPQESRKGEKTEETKTIEPDRGTETILFVEDEELLRTVIVSELESNGYTVHIAVDGQEAIDVFKQHQGEISLVLTDIGLPKQTGMDVFMQLREIDPKIKIILAGGFIPVDQKSELLKAGAKEFIQKPYVVAEVIQKIREELDEK